MTAPTVGVSRAADPGLRPVPTRTAGLTAAERSPQPPVGQIIRPWQLLAAPAVAEA